MLLSEGLWTTVRSEHFALFTLKMSEMHAYEFRKLADRPSLSLPTARDGEGRGNRGLGVLVCLGLSKRDTECDCAKKRSQFVGWIWIKGYAYEKTKIRETLAEVKKGNLHIIINESDAKSAKGTAKCQLFLPSLESPCCHSHHLRWLDWSSLSPFVVLGPVLAVELCCIDIGRRFTVRFREHA